MLLLPPFRSAYVDTVSATELPLHTPLQDLLNLYSELFKLELGYWVTTTAKLFLCDGAELEFC